MPSEGSEEVAADHSATETTPVGGSEVAGEAEGVEENPPLTVDPVAEDSRNWADLSEVLEESTAPSDQVATAELVPVKEEEQELQEAQSLGAVLSAIGLPEEVADEPVATEESALDFEQPSDQPFLEERFKRTIRPKLLSRTLIVQRRNNKIQIIFLRYLLLTRPSAKLKQQIF